MRILKPVPSYKINFKTKYTQQNETHPKQQATHQLHQLAAIPTMLTKSSHLAKKQINVKDAINSIKGEIHKLRTQSPQFTKISFIEQRSKSYFFSKNKRAEQKPVEILMKMVHKRTQKRRQTKSYLPELRISQMTKYSPKLMNSFQQQSAQPQSNVILLKRDMRYRLEKLPPFKPELVSETQPNITVSGWHRNSEDMDEFMAGLISK